MSDTKDAVVAAVRNDGHALQHACEAESGRVFKQSTAVSLGGSWVVISGVISPLIWFSTIVTLLITPLITTHEPPRKKCAEVYTPVRTFALIAMLSSWQWRHVGDGWSSSEANARTSCF